MFLCGCIVETNEFSPVEENSEFFTIFGQTFEISIFQSDPSAVFDLIRLNLNKLDRETIDSLNILGSYEISTDSAFEFRRDLEQIFKSLKIFLNNLRDRSGPNFVAENELKNLLFEIKGLLLDVGHLNKLHVFKTNGNRKNPSFLYFHLCLDIWWNVTSIFTLISQFWPSADCCSNFVRNVESKYVIDTSLSAFVKMLVFDLCLLGASYYPQETVDAHNWLFPCSCVEKFWLLLKRLIDDLSKRHLICTSFSTILRSTVSHLTSDSRPHGVQQESFSDQLVVPIAFTSTKVADKKLFCWNLVLSLQRLMTKNEPDSTENIFLNDTIEILIKSTIVDDMTSPTLSIDTEKRIRRYLSLFLLISKNYLRTASSTSEILLDPFVRHINESFFGGRTVDELTISQKFSAKKTVQNLKHLMGIEDCSSSNVQNSSFELFLQILSSECAADPKLSKTIRSRIFSKFHSGRVEGLSERGLMNFFDLFLLLAYRTGLNEVIEKLMEYFSSYDLKDEKTFDKTKIIMKSFVVLCMMHQEKRSDGLICTTQMRRTFDSLMQQYVAVRNDVVVRRSIWSCLTLYVDLMLELMNGVDEFDCGEIILLDVFHLESYLKTSKSNDDLKLSHMNSVFDLWRTIADRSIRLTEQILDNSTDSQPKFPDRLATVLNTIGTKIIPVCKQFLFGLGADVAHIDELWYFLTKAIYCKKGRRVDNDVVDLFDHYVWNSNISGSQACRYIAKIFSIINFDPPKAIGAWLRCVLTVTDGDSTLMTLTEFVSVQYLDLFLPTFSTELTHGGNPKESFKLLCRTIGANMSLATTSTWRPILEKPATFGVELLKKTESKEIFLHCNSLLAVLVENCAYILHRRDDPRSVLKAILEQTILFNGKLLSSKEKELKYGAISSVFASIIRGIIKSSAWQVDSFLRNSLSESYKMAFDRMSTLEYDRQSTFNVGSLIEPLRETFKENLTDVETGLCIFRKICVMKSICDLLDRCTSSKQIVLGLILTFYANLTESTKCGTLIVDESKEILPKAFSAWMRSDDSSTPLFVDTIVNTVCCRLLQVIDGKYIIIGAIKQLLQTHLGQHLERTMNIMKNLSRNAKVKNNLDLKEIYMLELTEIERKSGGAVSANLWSAAKDFN